MTQSHDFRVLTWCIFKTHFLFLTCLYFCQERTYSTLQVFKFRTFLVALGILSWRQFNDTKYLPIQFFVQLTNVGATTTCQFGFPYTLIHRCTKCLDNPPSFTSIGGLLMTFSHHKAFFEIPIKILFFLVFLQKKCSIQTVDLLWFVCCDMFVICEGI